MQLLVRVGVQSLTLTLRTCIPCLQHQVVPASWPWLSPESVSDCEHPPLTSTPVPGIVPAYTVREPGQPATLLICCSRFSPSLVTTCDKAVAHIWWTRRCCADDCCTCLWALLAGHPGGTAGPLPECTCSALYECTRYVSLTCVLCRKLLCRKALHFRRLWTLCLLGTHAAPQHPCQPACRQASPDSCSA